MKFKNIALASIVVLMLTFATCITAFAEPTEYETYPLEQPTYDYETQEPTYYTEPETYPQTQPQVTEPTAPPTQSYTQPEYIPTETNYYIEQTTQNIYQKVTEPTDPNAISLVESGNVFLAIILWIIILVGLIFFFIVLSAVPKDKIK